jgi:hypothetical protein
VGTRVARWYIFRPKIPIWVKLGGGFEKKMLLYYMAIWNILWQFDMKYGHLVFFVVIWYFSPVWYFEPRIIWQPW